MACWMWYVGGGQWRSVEKAGGFPHLGVFGHAGDAVQAAKVRLLHAALALLCQVLVWLMGGKGAAM